MSRRRTDGDETWGRLLEWNKGQKASERLSSLLISSEGYINIDPSHPLGGKDGSKDIICEKNNMKWIGACYFPRGQQQFNDILEKYKHDLLGVKTNEANGIIFITNQELRLAERKKMVEIGNPYSVDIFHLERIAQALDKPVHYGIRLEFLDIEMTKEEQLSYFAHKDSELIKNIMSKIDGLSEEYRSFKDLYFENDFRIRSRTEDEIVDFIEELLEKIWYGRHLSLKYKVEKGQEYVDPKIWEGALKSARRVEKKYGKKNIGRWDDFDWGMLNGKLSALRWVLGDEWDMLDT